MESGRISSGVPIRHQEEGDQGREQGGAKGDIGGIEDGAADQVVLPGAEILRRNDAAAAADSVEQRKEQEGNGACGSHRRQGVGPQQLPHDHGIRQVVRLLEKVSDQKRQRKNGKQCQRPAFRHIRDSLSTHGGPFFCEEYPDRKSTRILPAR